MHDDKWENPIDRFGGTALLSTRLTLRRGEQEVDNSIMTVRTFNTAVSADRTIDTNYKQG